MKHICLILKKDPGTAAFLVILNDSCFHTATCLSCACCHSLATHLFVFTAKQMGRILVRLLGLRTQAKVSMARGSMVWKPTL